MEGYITRETKWIKTEALTCSHPLVQKIWETGGMAMKPTDGKMILRLHILLYSGHVATFENHNPETPYKEAEEYLQSLA